MAKAKKAATVAAVAKEANGEAAAALFANYERLNDLSRENFAALLRANAALSQGLEEIGKEVILYARRSFEQAAETATALLGAKTFEDVFQLNSEFAKTNLERLIERSAKLSEMGAKVANEALAPLGGRVGATLHTLSKPGAA
jgi:phasin family protein